MEDFSLINKRTLHYLTGGILLLVLADIINYIVGMPFRTITRFISLNAESCIPAWYSSLLLAMAGLLSLQCFNYGKRKGVGRHWAFLLLAGLLFFMSCDEIAQFHERTGRVIAVLIARYSGMPLVKRWVWVGGPIIVGVFLGIIGLLRRPLCLVRRSGLLLVIGFSLIFLGGVILEANAYFILPIYYDLEWARKTTFVLEESFEMIGTIFVAHSLVMWRDKTRQL